MKLPHSVGIIVLLTILLVLMGSGGFIWSAGANAKTVFDKIAVVGSTGFTVRFNDKSGKIVKEETVSKGAAAIPPTSDPPESIGYRFVGWDQDYTHVTSDMTINPLFEKLPPTNTYPITVVGGTLSSGGTIGQFRFNCPISLIADVPPAGKKFSHWEQDGVKINISKTFTLFAPMKATTFTAVFVDQAADITEVPFITLSDDAFVDIDTKTILFTAYRVIPVGYKLVESGVILLQSNISLTEELMVNTYNAILGKISNDSSDEFYVRKCNIAIGDTWYARAYLIYQDSNGNFVTIYSTNTLRQTIN